jgi:hypothetical protein
MVAWVYRFLGEDRRRRILLNERILLNIDATTIFQVAYREPNIAVLPVEKRSVLSAPGATS